MMIVRHSYSAFIPEIMHCNEKTNAIKYALILYFLKPFIRLSSPSHRLSESEARTHYSTIPSFHHSNLGEAPNLISYSGLFFGTDCEFGQQQRPGN
jgi:hypothetical protein